MVIKKKGLAILGSTGSIGTQTLDIVRSFPNNFKVIGLAANNNIACLKNQIEEFSPKSISFNPSSTNKHFLKHFSYSNILMEDMVKDPDVDIVIAATNGCSSLKPIIEAINSKKNIGLANKESIVIAGKLISQLAKKNDVNIYPLDSEPNAIWQCIKGEDSGVNKLILTASGGAVRNEKTNNYSNLTPEQVLNHPNWKMGGKITIDSSTMVNKALEVAESHWLFNIGWEQIDIVMHPESIIHSMVEFDDGSIKAQLSHPDMRLPIQYALFEQKRQINPKLTRLDLTKINQLNFMKIDQQKYPCFDLALEFLKLNETWPAALCGIDETAVELFLKNKIKFNQIYTLIEKTLSTHKPKDDPNIHQIIDSYNWAKEEGYQLAKEL
ncbi:MAG: 1-deoxy-D-xylulose-5-phosphate reductoisomerase [Dehalococcoidia bacterium]